MTSTSARPPASADVIIVGGAVMGSAAAYYLATLGQFAPGRIVVIERDPTYAKASTPRSAGGLRQQFSTPENIALSQATLALLRSLKTTFGADADVGFKEQGYLILCSGAGLPILTANAVTQRMHGASTELLTAAALSARFPWLDVDGVAAGSFGPIGEGWLDPVALMELFRRAAKAKGVTFLSDAAAGIDVSGNRVKAVRLASGSTISCGAVINAAGPQCGEIAALAGLSLPVEPRKRYVYVLDCRAADDALRSGPLTVDPSGVWFRPEGQMFIAGLSPKEADEPKGVDLADLDAIDHSFFDERIWPTLAARVPAFEALKVMRAWSGYYDYNTLDQNAVIGPHPQVVNFLFLNGFSGHGLQQCAGAARAAAEHLVFGEYRTIDVARFGYQRIASGLPLVELNVI
jgi:FAD-dependent oxidoreductase domain-containing protein 1